MFSEFVLAIMMFRFLFLVRTILNYSIYSDAYSKNLAKIYGFESGFFFTFKSQFIANAKFTVLSILFFTILYLAYLFRIFELPYYRTDPDLKNALDSYSNAIYVIVITISTCGYGDMSPGTPFGRVVAMTTVLIGAFQIALFVATV